jgi:Flp pilus assembly pilin Flp
MTNLSIAIYSYVTTTLLRLREERGQDMIEYALFGGLLATIIMLVAALIILGTIPNPVATLLSGLSGCVDFNSATPCDPF